MQLANHSVASRISDGGTDLAGNVIRLYDPTADRWTVLRSKLPHVVMGPVAGYFEGKVYLTNGYRSAPLPKGGTTVGYWGHVSGF